MSFDKLAALYVFCMNYHEGQNSRLYRILSRISARGLHLTDSAIASIEDYTKDRMDEWFESRNIYCTLVQNHVDLISGRVE